MSTVFPARIMTGIRWNASVSIMKAIKKRVTTVMCTVPIFHRKRNPESKDKGIV